MTDYDDGSLDQFDYAQTNPAVPAGMSQAAQIVQGYQQKVPGYEASGLGANLDQYGYVDTARSWYTGANMEGVGNGWDTEWAKTFAAQQDKAYEDGTMADFYTADDATGVVTWDHERDGQTFTFGDIFDNGKRVGNLYDQFDTDTANLMMSDWLFDGTKKAELFKESAQQLEHADPSSKDPALGALDEEVKKQRVINTDIEKNFKAGEDFQADVDEKQDTIQEGWGDELLALGSAGATAVLGGAAGAAVGGPIGAVVGATVGFGYGGVSAYLNRDSMSEQAARAWTITEMSADEHSTGAAMFTGLHQASGFAARLMAPGSNLVQGLQDVEAGTVGDGEAEFYAVDEDGERKAGGLVRGADIVASVSDAFLQFASGPGLFMYTGQMTGTIVGEVGEMALTGGETFDFRTASFDNVFTDEDGNFDPKSGAAGIGKIGIDVVQLGMARGLAGKVNTERLNSGEAAAYVGVLGARGLGPGERKVIEGGRSYVVGADNLVVEGSRRGVALSMMAPSEMLRGAGINAIARREAAKRGGTATASDFYKVATEMSMGERKLQSTIVNAMGEGYEEGVQAILEPWSHNHMMDWREVGNAAAYGAAMGLGMGLGMSARAVTPQTKMYNQAKLATKWLTNGEHDLTRAEFDAMTPEEQRTLAAMDSLSKETVTNAEKKITHDQDMNTAGGVSAVHKANDAAMAWVNGDLTGQNESTDIPLVIVGLEDSGMTTHNGKLKRGSMPSDALATSADQLGRNRVMQHRGFEIQRDSETEVLKNFDANVDPSQDAAITAKDKAALVEKVDHLTRVVKMSKLLNDWLAPRLRQIRHPSATVQTVEADAEIINFLLRDTFHRRLDRFQGQDLDAKDKFALARATSMLFARDPHADDGSFQILVPQVSARLTASNSNNVLEVSHAILLATRGDYDGDKFRALNQLVLDEAEFTNLRSGANFIGAGTTVNIGTPHYEEYIVRFLAEASLPGANPTLRSYASGTLTNIGATLRARYTDPNGVLQIDRAILDETLESFYEAVRGNDPKARAVLLGGLAKGAGPQITEFARDHLSNEWLFIDQVVKAHFNTFQGQFAAQFPRVNGKANRKKVRPVKQQANVRTVQQAKGATPGQTMGQMMAGDTLFRMFQALHYTVLNAPVRSADGTIEAPMTLEAMRDLYEALQSAVTRKALEEIRAKDDVTGAVFLQLQYLAVEAQKAAAADGTVLGTNQALAVVANMAVWDVATDRDGRPTSDRVPISMTQALLKREVAKDAKKKAEIIAFDKDLQTRHARWMSMTRPNSRPKKGSKDKGQNAINAERAFVEVVGAQQFYTLLGEDAEVFGPHLTIEQYVRMYQSMTVEQRKQEKYRLAGKNRPEYVGSGYTKDMPYSFKQVSDMDVNAYRAVVDAVLAVGNNRLTIDDNGTVHGELAEKSHSTSQDFWNAFLNMRGALQAQLRGQRDDETTVDMVRILLDANPEVARAYWRLVPNALAFTVIRPDGTEAKVANWFYEMLTMKDAKHAEMHYWRNILKAELQGLRIDNLQKIEAGEEFQTGYDSLPRLIHRVVVDLGRQSSDMMMRQFINRLEDETDLERFLSWVNTTPGIRGNNPPVTAWADDTAELDATKAQGGWTKTLEGAERREAMLGLRTASANLHRDMIELRNQQAEDAFIRGAIRQTIRAHRGERGAQSTEEGEIWYRQMLKTWEVARDIPIGISPEMMVFQTIGAVEAFGPHSHEKGDNPDNVKVSGLVDGVRDAYGYDTNFNRVFAAGTTYDIEDIDQNPTLLAKGDVRFMTHSGHIVEWKLPDTSTDQGKDAMVEMWLDLFDNPETRRLANNILVPQVYQRTDDGRLVTQLVHNQGLRRILDGSAMNDLFPDENGRMSPADRNMHGTVLNAIARRRGAHAALERKANELAIARTSAATTSLQGDNSSERMAQQAYSDIIQVLQMAATISLQGELEGKDLLKPILKLIRQAQIQVRASRTLGIEVSSLIKEGYTYEGIIDLYVLDLERAREDKAAAMRAAHKANGKTTIAEDAAYVQEVQRMRDDYEWQLDRVEVLRTNNTAKLTYDMFAIPEGAKPSKVMEKRKFITDYIMANLKIGQFTGATDQVNQLTQYMQVKGNTTPPEFVDWDVLGRAATTHYLNRLMGTDIAGSSPLFPDAKHADYRKYFDSTFMYLIEDLLTEGNVLLESEKELQKLAGRHAAQVEHPDRELMQLIGNTVLDNSKLGDWTDDIPRVTISADERLDSASSVPVLSQAGDAPKDETYQAAFRRTYEVPPPEMLSTVVLTLGDITPDIDPTKRNVAWSLPPGWPAHPTQPMMQMSTLNNRFAASVKVTLVDRMGRPIEFELLEDPNAGKTFQKDAGAASSGYKVIHPDVLYRSLDRILSQPRYRGFDPESLQLTVAFFHPDTQPASTEKNNKWTNNLFFEGTNFVLDSDQKDSLHQGLNFSPGGMSPKVQAEALESAKKGTVARRVIVPPGRAVWNAIEATWQTGLAQMLRRKVDLIMATDLGTESDPRLDPGYYNVLYKMQKSQTFVRGSNDKGQMEVWSAEQVIEFQIRNPGAAIPLSNAQLWIPSRSVFQSMLGEQGDRGVPGVRPAVPNIRPDSIDRYIGVRTAKWAKLFPGMLDTRVLTIKDTSLPGRPRQLAYHPGRVRSMEEKAKYSARIKHRDQLWSEISDARAVVRRRDDGGWNPSKMVDNAAVVAGDMLDTDTLPWNWTRAQAAWMGTKDTSNPIVANMIAQDQAGATKANSWNVSFVYRENGRSMPAGGELSATSLNEDGNVAFRVAPGDNVIVVLSDFEGDVETAKKRLHWLAGRHANIFLGTETGDGEMYSALAPVMTELGYTSVLGTRYLYKPEYENHRYQNIKARNTSYLETRPLDPRRLSLLFHTRMKQIDENTLLVNKANPRNTDVRVTMDLVPLDAYAGYGVPTKSTSSDESQVRLVRDQLQNLDTVEGRSMLAEMTNGGMDAAARPAADAAFLKSWERMMARFNRWPGEVLPQADEVFGTGDLIPLIGPGNKVLLYRHGYKGPTTLQQIKNMQKWQLPERTAGGAGVAIYSGVPNSASTTHEGRVVRTHARSGFAMSIEMDIDLQLFGDKLQLEWNGMKYIVRDMPNDFGMPGHAILGSDRGIDGVSDLASLLAKEADDGLVNNHRNAFALFGINLLPYITEHFYPGKGKKVEFQRQALTLLNHLENSIKTLPVRRAHELISGEYMPKELLELLPVFPPSKGFNKNWQTGLGHTGTVESQITTAAIIYLLVPGTKAEDILSSGGMNDETNTLMDRTSRLMPRLFTQYFDAAPLGSPLRREMNKQFNLQINNSGLDYVEGHDYILGQDFTLEIRNKANPEKSMTGLLQFSEMHSSGDNPVLNGQAFDRSVNQNASLHSAAIGWGAIGADTPLQKGLDKAAAKWSGEDLIEFKEDSLDGGAWRLFNDLSRTMSRQGQVFRALTPGEEKVLEVSAKALIQYRSPINQKNEQKGWNKDTRKLFVDARSQLATYIGVAPAMVDGWVRQELGRPDGKDVDGNYVGDITADAALEATQRIYERVLQGMLPTTSAMVPAIHLHDLQDIYRANKNRPNGWAPKTTLDPTDSTRAAGWDEWVKVAIGSAITTPSVFNRLFLAPLDGFLHTYRNAIDSLMDLPVSLDAYKAGAAMNPAENMMVAELALVEERTNRLKVSVNPTTDALASRPIVLDSASAELDSFIGGRLIAGEYRSQLPPASEIQKERNRKKKWHRDHDVPFPVEQKNLDFLRNGDLFTTHGTETNALIRVLINLRVGTACLNPQLYLSMGPEQWVRGTLDRVANILTGQASVGATAHLQARISERIKKGTGKTATMLQRQGVTTMYSPEQMRKLNGLYSALGRNGNFRSMLNTTLMYLRPYEPGMSKFERGVATYAKVGARVQDPTYGMKMPTLARRYIEAAVQFLESRPTANVLTIDQLINELSQNPTFLQQHFPEAHLAASNAVAQIRSLKETVLSQTLKGIYEPLSASSNPFFNFAGNFFLKIPLLFSGYAMNVLTTITGMQGLDQLMAMHLDGRPKGILGVLGLSDKPGGIFWRMQKAFRGDSFTERDDQMFDMSAVLEGVDLSRAFIRGGLTHSGLFMLGLAAGGLGLSGEDEESKKRRRLAEMQGTPYIYDPMALENDFRNKDAMFIDWIPFIGGSDEMVQLNWTLKQFISPIMGMEKFFETGDFNHVTWGFKEALGSFPLINSLMWEDAVETAHLLAAEADKQQRSDDPSGTAAAAWYLTNAVGVYERMLFENAFVNQLYVSLDTWDRDPYALPLRDSDGDLQVDIEGNTRPNDLAMSPYIDPETGEVSVGYKGRDTRSGTMHALTENRATLGFVSSLFTGGTDSDYWRYNMPIKERNIELKPRSQADSEQIFAGAYLGLGNKMLPSLTMTEATALARKRISDSGGEYWNTELIESEAQKLVNEQGLGAMSVIDSAGREALTTEGAMAVFKGLASGSVQFGDPSLQGLYITHPQRLVIQEQWTQALIQEGMDLGMDITQATKRMQRLWNGDYGTDQVGLGEILWTEKEKLSYSDTLTYKQLNTTYIIGPDGYPWATGASRGGVLSSIGLMPFMPMLGAGSDAMGLDERLNSTDLTHQINTGLRGLVLKDRSEDVPTDKEIADSIIEAIEKAGNQTYTPYTPFAQKSSGGYGGYGGGFGYGGYGGGGGGYYGPRVYFEPLRELPNIRTPYANNTPFINTTNPIIRRADVRRERVWSERGRLFQWQ